MPRRQGYALLIALLAGTAVLAAATVFGTTLLSGRQQAPPPPAETHETARNPVAPAHVGGDWIATWTTAPVGPEPNTDNGFPGSTIRNVVHTSAGGDAARITLSNLFGAVPLLVDQATVNTRRVTFDGATSIAIAAGGQVVSDPVVVPVAPDSDLEVGFRTPRPGGPVTYHPNSHQTSYLADSRGTWSTTSWRYLTAVDVRNESAPGTIAVIGDSLTAGSGSTTDANTRWPDVLADRLGGRYGVANAGIAGNRLLIQGTSGQAGLVRFERDALSVAGARTVIVALGINDIQQAPQETDAGRIVAGLRALTDQARARGLTVVGATLTPFEGFRTWTPERNAVRLAVNEQIRTGTVFDAYVDFDEVVRDPSAPNRLLAAYDSGDGVHFNDAGYRALGERIDLPSLERAGTRESDEL
ncbi:SGNH/GDSL hydrolase family protein [Streptomyces sp. ISL-112]|uniref:SGNH/GDSL hydrolase family protein n=1 Tax=unclassified Streptomyces TaxID=2593676 RepID=UPI001BE5C0C7|nr:MULTISPECIES: SGNH/GDSL hydrolase family protein [unclassified Streptomyces]MBT2427087.1 SGNH/GDSL hydrolase family protein [Streptomyces sp. ISL-112]MBT2461648.1 SGNH/GDSL hydrolase family protein [Streptomyces sp. ISL-63]